ncbi:protein KNATM-like [Neltuma alba]|uniref:protein KNATM-like n=1 Tax=Neltuma alba TaxID=207710 RepID=UPI0010A3AA5B|nr:protein KNATM-like [Prosopis alba]
MEAAINGENEGEPKVVVDRNDHTGDKDTDEQLRLKKMIASHPLYGILIQSHFNCLKVGLGETAEFDTAKDAVKQSVNSKPRSHHTTSPSSSELDHFMEAYCVALSKLKEAIEEPTRETKAFISGMYIDLKDLTDNNNIQPNDPQQESL